MATDGTHSERVDWLLEQKLVRPGRVGHALVDLTFTQALRLQQIVSALPEDFDWRERVPMTRRAGAVVGKLRGVHDGVHEMDFTTHEASTVHAGAIALLGSAEIPEVIDPLTQDVPLFELADRMEAVIAITTPPNQG